MKKIITLFSLLLVSVAFVTAKDIRGRVSNGESILPNVYIYLKNNPSFSVLTAENGEFRISLEGIEYLEDDRIIFSYMGYETKEYRIKELSDSICHEIILVENLMILEGAIVMGSKLSRKEKKNRKISIIKQFKQQASRDFVFEDRTFKVVSDLEVSRNANMIFYNKLIGEYKELIGVLPDKRDSICLTYTDIKHYIDNDIEMGLEKMSDRFIDNNVVSKKRKENKRVLDSLFYQTVLSDSAMLEKMLNLHKSFWFIRRNIGKEILNIEDKHKEWEILETNEQTIIRYKTKSGLLGIVKSLGVTDFIVDPNTYSIERIIQDLSMEFHIPFGYRLTPDLLMFLNIINAGSEEMEKYRVRHLYIDATINIIYKKIGASKYKDEMAFNMDISVIDTKKRNIKGESRGLVKVVSIEDN